MPYERHKEAMRDTGRKDGLNEEVSHISLGASGAKEREKEGGNETGV